MVPRASCPPPPPRQARRGQRRSKQNPIPSGVEKREVGPGGHEGGRAQGGAGGQGGPEEGGGRVQEALAVATKMCL